MRLVVDAELIVHARRLPGSRSGPTERGPDMGYADSRALERTGLGWPSDVPRETDRPVNLGWPAADPRGNGVDHD